MGKIKSKDHNTETQFLKSKIRDLEKQVRQLEKQLKFYTKKDHLYDDIRDEIQEVIHKEDEVIAKKDERIDCEKCNTGHMTNLLELLGKWYGECSNCGHRKRVK